MVKNLDIILMGFGNAASEFARVLVRDGEKLNSLVGYNIRVIGITTKTRGNLVNRKGVDLKRALHELQNHKKFLESNPDLSDLNLFELIEQIPAFCMVEATPLNIETGRPAIDHIKTALSSGKHVITINKGPVVWALNEIEQFAEEKGRHFLYEGVVMDGTPLFNLVKYTLPGCKVLGFRGILNSTTNFLLDEMEKGIPYDQALKEAQRLGFAEADPSLDVDGWDAAAKTIAIMNVLMGADLTLHDVEPIGIRGITYEDIKDARDEGYIIRLLCEGKLENGKYKARVSPEKLEMDDPLAHVRGTTSALTLYTDYMKELTIVETDPEILQTAYAIISDLINLVRFK